MTEAKTKYMGIDYGEKRVGIAVSDEEKKYSFARDYILNSKKIFFEEIFRIILEENIKKIIIGHPLNFKSEKTIQTLAVEKFAEELRIYLFKNKTETEIIFFDERFTSKIAQESLNNSGLKKSKRKEKGLVDSISAQIILQDYIDKTNSLNKINIYI